MIEILLQTFLGWPAMLASLMFALAGILLRKWQASTLGAVLFLAPGWYLSHYSVAFAILPILLFGAAYSVSKGQIARAVLLLIPVLVGIVALAIFVLSQ